MNKLILLLVLACPLTAVAQNWTGSNACVDSDGYSFVNFSGAGSRIDTLSAPVRLDGHSARIQTFIIVQQEWQTLRLAGKIRTEIPVGRAEIQLDLRSDMNSYEGRIYSEDLHFSNNEWRPFEIEIALSDEVNYCMTTVFVNGEGTAWVADLHLTADNKPIQSPDSFKPYTPIYPADSQTFSGTSGFIAAAKSGRQQLENLKAACRAWGEIKYLHPAVARGEFNMDNKLFELLPLIYNASSKEQKRILNAWKAEFGTYNPSAALPVYHYYFGTAFPNGPAIFRHEHDYADMEYTDAGLRLLGAFRLWNAVRYFSPNLELAEDQNIVLTEAIENMLAANDRAGYLRALQHIAAGMHDNHVHIGTKHNDTTIMVAPFNSTQFIDGKYIITNIYGDNNPLRVGDAITHRNGRTIEEFITENAYIISASNSPGLARQAGAMLNISRDQSPILLSIEREGHRMEIEVPVYSLEKFAEIGGKNYIMQGYYSSQESGFRILEDSIAYIHIGNITDADLPIDDYNKVIVDMRSYPNIDTRSLIGRLLPETAEIASFTSPDPLHPGRFNMMEGDYIPGLSTKPDRKIVVLVNEWTQSAAEYIVMMLQNNPKIYVLGSQTAGADGNVTAITLPGAMSMSFTGLGVFYPDGRPTQRVGIHIDEILRPTIESIRTGKDNIITRAVEILSE